MLQCGVGGEDGVVRLHHGSGHLGSGVDGELQLGFLAIVHGQPLHQKGSKPGPSPAAEGVEDEETLQAGALVGQLADPVQHKVYHVLAHCVVAAGVVVGRVLLSRQELFGVEQLAVGPRTDLVHHRRLQVNEHRARNVLPGAGLAEERVEGVVSSADGLVGRHLSVRLNSVLEAVKLPAGIANLHARLSHVDRDTLAHLG